MRRRLTRTTEGRRGSQLRLDEGGRYLAIPPERAFLTRRERVNDYHRVSLGVQEIGCGTMATKKNSTGLPAPLPRCPGDVKAEKPADTRESGGQLPDWLNPAKAKWTQDRVNAIDRRMKSRAGVHQVSDGSQLTDIPGYRVLDEKHR